MREKAAAVALAAKATSQVLWPRKQDIDWRRRRWRRGDNQCDLRFDIPTALFSLAARDHPAVAEIGAGDGRRAVSIKETNADVDVFALDISESYQTTETIRGVSFMKFSLANLHALPAQTLVCSVGTLYLLPWKHLSEMFCLLSERGHSLFWFEPVALIPVTESFPCRTISGGFYHPYDALAETYGFADSIPAGAHWKATGRIKDLEQWRYGYFRPKG